MDWTEFDADGQATIMLSLLSRHGRATPLVWLTVDKATLKNRRNGYEYQVLVRLAEILPAEVRVRIVADRGFGDHKLYRVLSEELKFDFVIRFRGNIAVTATDGEARAAADWVGAGGRARTLRGAAVTAQAYPVATVVCVRAKGMKEPWCLAASTPTNPRGLDREKHDFRCRRRHWSCRGRDYTSNCAGAGRSRYVRRNGYTAPGCAIWKQLAQDRAHNAAVEETWKRENAARERAQQKAADELMKRYAADKAAQDAHPPWGGFWYIHGSVAGGCEDVSFVFRHRDKSMGSPLEYGAYLKSNGTLAFDRTT